MRALKIFGFFVLILLVISFITVTFFGGTVARAVVASLNRNLQTEIKVAKYDVTLLRSFPNLSVNLSDVEVAGSDGSQLLVAERLRCLLDLGSLFGKIRIKEIVVEEGRLQLLADVDGNVNYQLMGYTPVGEEPEPAGEATEFAVEDAQFRDVEVIYRDAQLQVDFTGLVDQLSFSGDFGAEAYLMSTDGKIDIHYLDQDGERYLSNQSLVVTAQTKVDNTNSKYTFAPLRVEAGDLDLEVVGDLQSTADGLSMELRVESQSGSLQDVIALIPPSYAGGLGELETDGDLLLSAAISGSWTQRAYPRLDGQLTFTDGRVGSPRTNVGARDLNLKARFAYITGDRGGYQSFAIEELTGSFRNEPFAMTLSVENLDDPRINFTADGALALGALPGILGESPLTGGDGFVRVQKLRISGRYEDMLRPRRMGNVAASGSLTFDNGELTINERELSFPSGSLVLRDNELELTNFAFKGPGTEINFTGRATNLIPVLFADSLNTNDAELIFDAKLEGTSVDIDELLTLAGPTEAEEEIAAATGATDSLRAKTMTRRTQITDLLRGRFDANVAAWNYGEMKGENFRGQLIFTPRQLDLRGVTQAMNGELKIDGEVYFQELQRVEGRIAGRGIDVEQFFAQSENFGQEVLVAENIKGAMDANIYIEAYFDEQGLFDYEKLRVLAGVSIGEGELKNFEMLENFAFALKSGDLERVRFTRLENYFEIVDQTIYIPAMFIQSSALNLEISGSHTFNNFLDYYVKVNAGQAIANKIGKHDAALEILPARRRGFFNLYYTIKGPLEEYAVESDKRGVKNDFERSQYRKDRVRQELAERFAEPIQLLEATGETEDENG